ncbi:MAG: pantetheine-phosphate adenylyltransferase [Clostridiales bacterium]|nr:pantetheine-phosphate adenylyltransferase [Clostridiales bacterium]
MKAILAGTFDPFTIGHRDLVLRTLGVFGGVTIAVAADTEKNPAPVDVRVDIAKAATADLSGVTVERFDGLLSDYIKTKGDCVLVRGIRNSRDSEYERDHARIYKSLCGVDMVCFMTSAEYEHISSTVVRTLASLGCELDGYIVPQTTDIIKDYYGKKMGNKEVL